MRSMICAGCPSAPRAATQAPLQLSPSNYRTYATTVEDEVRAALARPEDFLTGPVALTRDSPNKLDAGFTVRDGNYLSARWPGDAHRFASELASKVERPNV